ncbi:MAG: GIY-YIG nuclease family protein [Candidatus Omnitrophota bacterium]
MKQYYVYILSSYSGVLYIGVTKDLIRRVGAHKAGWMEGFTKKYKVDRLVYYEVTTEVMSAIAREKQLKSWRREKKERLIGGANPEWKDLYRDILGA